MNKGFTLIELMVVISIMSLLASVVLFQTSEAKLKADDSKMIAEAKEVEKAIVLYKEEKGMVPAPTSSSYYTGGGGMVREGSDDDDYYEEVMQELVDEGYLPAIPKSPDGESYSYMPTSNQEEAVFAAALNSGISNNSNNSCDVVEGDIEYSWGACDIEYGGNCEDYKPVEGAVCFDIFNDSDLASCDPDGSGNSNNEQFPDYICDINVICTRGFPSTCEPSVSDPGAYFCEGEVNGAVCSGSSNTDYCSCI